MSVQRAMRWVVPAALACAGCGKLLALASFGESLRGWTLVPLAWIPLVKWLVPLLETLPATLGLFGVCWRVARWFSACVVAGLMFAYLVQLMAGRPPDCECWGVWEDYVGLRQTSGEKALMGIGAIVLVICTWREPIVRGVAKGNWRSEVRVPGQNKASGFSLIELLVAIAIVAILVGLTLPLVRRIRMRSDLAGQLGTLAEHGKVMHLYAIDYKDAWPALDPRAPGGRVTWSSGEFPRLTSTYFGLSANWPKLLFAGYYDGNLFHPSFRALPKSRPPVTSYYLTQSLWAEADFWRAETRTGPKQWRGTRVDEVVFPSQKILMTNFLEPPPGSEVGHRPPGVTIVKPVLPASLVDASARGVPPEQLHDGYPQGSGTWPGSYLSGAFPGLTTIDGVRGRDLR